MSREKNNKSYLFRERLRNNIPEGVTQKEIADSVGVSLPAFRKWLNGDSLPTFEYIETLAKVLHKSINWIITGEDESEEKNNTKVSFINVYDAELSAGPGSYMDEASVVAQYALPDLFFTTYSINRQKAAGVPIRGDSMEPLFHNGDIAIVDRSEKRVDNDGVYAFYYQGRCFIKHLQFIGGKLFAISSNKAYEKWEVDGAEDFKLIGMVKAAVCRI